MNNAFIDPALLALVDEQQQFIAGLTGHFAPPPAEAPLLLPAVDVQLPGAAAASAPLSMRVIKPDGACRGVYLHIHGGGFMHGNAAMGDAANSVWARLGVATVSVDYRLAPAHVHPAAVDDCVHAARWLIDECASRFGTTKLLMGGESVGASLAVLTLLQLRQHGGLQRHFCAANLVVGNYDFSMTPSQRAATERHFLSPQHLAEMRAAAFPGLYSEALRDPAISSLYADLNDLPAALFTIGTADAVLDDSLFMAMRWQAAGNQSQLQVYPQAPHLFMTYPTRMAAEARKQIQAFLLGFL